MSRNTEHQFFSTDAETLVADLVAAYEKLTGVSVQPASPEKLFILWVADVLIQERVLNNYTGNQNIPSRAEGENLDALGELFYVTERPAAQSAVCTQRFRISQPQESAVLVPAGTRVTDASNTLVWQTTEDAYIPIGATYIDVPVRCRTEGVVGNGYAIGQINTLIDMYDYCAGVENITVSDDGADKASDEEFYQLMRASQDGFSTAGAKGAYIYYAKKVSTEIADVVANSPQAGHVRLYALMHDGNIASEEMKAAILAACNPDDVRALTDYVAVADPELVRYNIDLTYYVSSDTTLSSAGIEAAVDAAIKEYVAWQCGRLGRDINPSKLYQLLMGTGIKRVVLTSPSFTVLRDGRMTFGKTYTNEETVPQVAAIGTIKVTNGGHEDE